MLFVVDISLNFPVGVSREDLFAAEQAVTAELASEGVVRAVYVKADFAGAYLVARAESESDLQRSLKRLPLHPYMTMTISPIVAEFPPRTPET